MAVCLVPFALLPSLLSLCLSLIAPFFLFFLFQSLNNPVNGIIPVLFRHLCKSLQRILQMHSLRVWNQFVEHHRPFRQLLIVCTVLVQHTDCGSITALGIAEFFLQPIQITQLQQQDTLFNTVSRPFLVAFLVGSNRIGCIPLCQIDIAYGIIHLVKIVLVVVRSSHSLEAVDGLLRILFRHHLRHRNAGIELHFVRRMLSQHALVCLVSLFLVADKPLQLPHQEPFPCTLLTPHLVLDYLPEIRNCLVIFLRVYIVISKSVVPLLHGTPVHRVTLHVPNHILRIIHPTVFNITLCKPRPRLTENRRLCMVQSCHIGEG